MVFWFAGVSLVAVWAVFRSPALDYRLVMLGALLPLGDIFLGGPRVLHALVGSVAALFLVMIATRNRRLVRRRWIGLPIGMMMHLVLGGIWANTVVFAWPFFGFSFGSEPLPLFGRPVVLTIVMELVGVACLVWAYRRFGLDDLGRRGRFIRTGQFDRTMVDCSSIERAC